MNNVKKNNVNMWRTPADLLAVAPKVKPAKPKNRDYCIIDHIGSIDNKKVVDKAYKLAEQLSVFPGKTYKMKEFCRMLSGMAPYEEPTKKQKNFVRFNKHPRQVILIVPMSQGFWDPAKQDFDWDDHQDYDRISSKNRWWADTWAEKADSVTILACGDDVEVVDMEEQHPEWFSCKNPTDSTHRRCAAIWGSALGWQFSAPLYRSKASEIDVMKYKRHRNPELEDINQALAKACPKLKNLKWFDLDDLAKKVMSTQKTHPEWFDKKALNRFKAVYADLWAEAHVEKDDDETKTSHSPKKYLESKTVASEEECNEFFKTYRFLWEKNMLKESLAEGYQLCPKCGRPIRLEKNSFCIEDIKNILAWDAVCEDIPEHTDDKLCEHCGEFRIPAKFLVVFERYWDDSFREDDDE